MKVIVSGILPPPPGVATIVPVNFAQGFNFSLKEKVRPFYRST